MFYTLDQGDHYVPIISPVDLVATDVDSAWVKISNAHFVEFGVLLGTITGDTLNITIECATEAASTSAVTAECYYRFSSAVTNDTWESVTTADTLGVTITASDDDKLLLLAYDPSSNPEYNYVRLALVTGGSMSACEVGAYARLHNRYPGNTVASTT